MTGCVASDPSVLSSAAALVDPPVCQVGAICCAEAGDMLKKQWFVAGGASSRATMLMPCDGHVGRSLTSNVRVETLPLLILRETPGLR